MKKTLMTLTAAAAMGFGSLAMAGPVMMTDTQLDTIVAGKTMFVWTDMDGEYIVSGNKHLSPGVKNPGNKNGWDAYQTNCESTTGVCTNGGSIAEVETFSGSGVYEWEYTAP